MKFEKTTLAAIVAALSVIGTAQADDQEKTLIKPVGAKAQIQVPDSDVQADTDTNVGADASISVDEPAGAEVKIDEAAGAETDTIETDPKKFVMKAAQGGMAEVKIGQLAAGKAESSSVKQYGDKLAKDHQAANDKLKTIAQKQGITISQDVEQKHQKHIDHLTGLSGKEFDTAFLKHATECHRKGIKQFEKQAQEGEDPSIRSFASETLPTLREHLRIAETLQQNPNASLPELREPAGAERPSDAQQNSPSQSDVPSGVQDSTDDDGAADDSDTDDAASDDDTNKAAQP